MAKKCLKCKKCGKGVAEHSVSQYWGRPRRKWRTVVYAECNLCHKCWCDFMESLCKAGRAAAKRFCKDTKIPLELGYPNVEEVQAKDRVAWRKANKSKGKKK
jgi:hypothetical protein